MTDDAAKARKQRHENGGRRFRVSRELAKLPSTAEEWERGVDDVYAAELLLKRVERYATSTKGLSERSRVTYRTYWIKFLRWAYDDWLKMSNGRSHPYVCSCAQVQRYVERSLNSTNSAGTDGTNACEFSITQLRNVKSAMIVLFRAFVAYEEELIQAGAVDDADKAAHLTLPPERNTLDLGKQRFWKQKKTEEIRFKTSVAAGSKATTQFDRSHDIMNNLSSRELDVLADWTADSRRSCLQSFMALCTLSLFILLAEMFFARPAEIQHLKLANVGNVCVDAGDYPAIARHHHLVYLAIEKHKGSAETGKSELRWAVRHSDVRKCAVHALMQALFLNFHVVGLAAPDLGARDTSHERARKYPKSVTPDYVLHKRPVPMIQWHGRHVFFTGRQSIKTDASEYKALPRSSALRCPFDDMSVGEQDSIVDLLREIRHFECVSSDDVTRYMKALHRRGWGVNRALLNGATQDGLEQLGGWAGPHVCTTHYTVLPPMDAVIAVAGCNARASRSYYLEYERDTLPVCDELQKQLFPFVETLEEETRQFEKDGWPAHLVDEKVEGFLKFLRYCRTTLWQDWAMEWALDERRARAARAPLDAESTWSFFDSAFFRACGEPWKRLREDAYNRVVNADARIPKHVQSIMTGDAPMQEVLLDVRESLQRVQSDLREQRAAHGDVRELKSMIAELTSKVDVLTRGPHGVACLSTPARAEPVPAASRDAASAVLTLEEAQKLGGPSTPCELGKDLVRAINAWNTLLERATGAKFDAKTSSYLTSRRNQHALFYRALHAWSQAFHNRERALIDLEKAARKQLTNGMVTMLHEFQSALKQVRKDKDLKQRSYEKTCEESAATRELQKRCSEMLLRRD